MSDPSVIDGDARAILAARIADGPLKLGPWLGSMRSVPPERVPREYMAGGLDFLFMPRYGYFRRRGGQTIKFEPSVAGAVGLLPAKWGARWRWTEEFKSDSVSDGIPTLCGLATKETVLSGLDDGRFANFWVRDQVNGLNYTVGSEYNTTTTYPAPGAAQSYKIIPEWYDSGDGGLTRGTSEFNRRFLFSGSRRFLKVGNWTYHPNVLGTPNRWNGQGMTASATAVTLIPSSNINTNWAGPFTGPSGSGAAGTLFGALATNDDNTLYTAILEGVLGNNPQHCGLSGPVPTNQTWTATIRVRGLFAPTTFDTGLFTIDLYDNAGNGYHGSIDLSGLSTPTQTTWTTFTTTIVATGAPNSSPTTSTPNSVRLGAEGIISAVGVHVLTTFFSVAGTSTTSDADRLIPSGPIPPVHAGLLVKGNPVAGSAGTTTIHPDADVSDGAWLGQDAGTSLFSYIDEVTVNDADYIVDAGVAGTLCEIGIGDPGFTPTGSTHTMRISLRASGDTIGAVPTLTVHLRDATTTLATASFTAPQLTSGGSTAARWISYDLTPAEVTAAGAVATDLRFRFTAGGTGGVRVYYAAIEITTAGEALLGGWRGKDRFFHSIAYRFIDESVWATCTPRFPNTRLPNGYNLFTIDSANTETAFDKVTWSNLPVPPNDVKSIILLRTPKIDSTADDNLQLNPNDLRVVVELKAGTTSYDDYASEDDALGVDVAQLLIRYDHIMPPRARYIAGGDMRVVHSYGGTNPCAIELAPVGAAADYDRNLADDNASAYAVKGMYFRIVIDSSGVGTIEFKRGSDTAIALAFVDHPKLQDLVDKINSTDSTLLSGQWRAQLCPGVSAQADCLASLTPHSRAIASVVRDGTDTITKAAGGLGKVAVGARVSGTGYTNDTYVIRIISDTSLQLSATATAGTGTATFYFDLGDTPDTGFERQGWQRVIANSLPGFIYFNKTYLATDTFDKSATWMTTASPGSNKSAANNFSGKGANRFTPPLDAGISMGAAAVDQGFRVFYANKRGVIRNTTQSEQGSGVDEEYRLLMSNHSSGCCAWNTVVGNGKFAIGLAPEGLIAGNLDKEVLLTEHIWQHGASEGSSGSARGDFSYEVPKAVAATSADVDYLLSDSTITAYASARIMRGVIYVNYRTAASTTHPNRQDAFDFSSGDDANGIEALFRKPGQPWGWSEPLARAFTAMTEGRRTDGAHLYGWSDANAGSTGDGRVDEFETGDTDNGTAISTATIDTPAQKRAAGKVSVQRAILEHLSPSGSTGSLVFHRGIIGSLDNYTLTPGTSATDDYVRDVIDMPGASARSAIPALYFTYGQASGAARELRYLEIWLKELPAHR